MRQKLSHLKSHISNLKIQITMNYKKSNAEVTTITRNITDFEAKAESIYEAVVVMSKRANQIASEIKSELDGKLSEFASTTDNLEEVFENREQIEISKFYEGIPKPALIAVNEFLEDKIYFRRPSEDHNNNKEKN